MRVFPAVVAAVAAGIILLAGGATAARAHETIIIGIDADPAGNEATSIGSVESCRTVSTGETFQIDVFVKGIPPAEGFERGLSGFGFNFLYDPAVLQVTGADANFMLAAGGTRNPFTVADDLPDRDGDFRIDEADLSRNFEHGDGILLRVTLEAVGTGMSTLLLDDKSGPEVDNTPDVFGGAGIPQYDIAEIHNAAIGVGVACTAPSPVFPAPQPGGGGDTGDHAHVDTGAGGDGTVGTGGETGGGSGATGGADGETGQGDSPDAAGGATGRPGAADGAGDGGAVPTGADTGDGGGLGTAGLIAIFLGIPAVAVALGAGGWLAWRRLRTR